MENKKLNELHLFAGVGGGILGGILCGHTCVCAVEIEHYCQQVLLERQRDGMLPKFPIWGDVRTFDAKPWRGIANVICGGFPCQDISYANNSETGGSGIAGARSGLWGEMARIINEVRPNYVFVENASALLRRGLGRILSDLARMGFNAQWGVFRANETGAFHQRKRLFILAANSDRDRLQEAQLVESMLAKKNANEGYARHLARTVGANGLQGMVASGLYGKGDAMAGFMDRYMAAGNGQVPDMVKLAWTTLLARHGGEES